MSKVAFFPFLLVVSLLTCCIEVDISVPSFPDISDYFGISDATTQMTIAVNFIGFCVSSGLYGPLSDSIGRRNVMLVGNAIMMIGAVGCFFADSIEFLLFARFLQGLGASASTVVVFAMVTDVYSVAKSERLVGVMNASMTVFMSLAPIVGSFLNETVGWRGNYGVIALVSVISWFMLYFWLPETKSKLQILSFFSIKNDFKMLLTDGKFLIASSIPSLYYAGWISFVSCSSFLYMETYELPIMYYALHQGAIISVFSFVSFFAGEVAEFIGEKKCIIIGIFISCTAISFMFILSLMPGKSPYLTSLSMMIYGTGSAIVYPVVFVRSLEIFPEIKGTASSAIMAMRALICAGFVAIVSYFYAGQLINVAIVLLVVVSLIVLLTSFLLKKVRFGTN
jgi:DHA1 family bicyclomycin/chloramphenicol resistance-like MFS transporter